MQAQLKNSNCTRWYDCIKVGKEIYKLKIGAGYFEREQNVNFKQ